MSDIVTVPGTKLKAMQTRIAQLEAALAVLLDQVDYTSGACGLTEMVGAVLSAEIIEKARKALRGE